VSKIGTQSAHIRAPFLDSVEHEGRGWFPTLDWVGEAQPALSGWGANGGRR
jgi:hypothetical protein